MLEQNACTPKFNSESICSIKNHLACSSFSPPSRISSCCLLKLGSLNQHLSYISHHGGRANVITTTSVFLLMVGSPELWDILPPHSLETPRRSRVMYICVRHHDTCINTHRIWAKLAAGGLFKARVLYLDISFSPLKETFQWSSELCFCPLFLIVSHWFDPPSLFY